MNKKYDILSLGEIMLRLSPLENERINNCDIFKKNVAGAELNVAAGASLLGMKTGMISILPNNNLGTYARMKMKGLGVDDTYVLSDCENDARLGIYYYENGAFPRKPQVVYDRKNSSIGKINISKFTNEIYKSAKCFHTTGITLALNKSTRETTIEMMKKFKEAGAIISFDVNFRGNLWSGEEAKKCIERILPYVDIFFCSEDTARLTFNKEGNLKSIMKSFTEDFPISIVASTRRIVHSPKYHSFGSVIYNAKNDTFYTEDQYENIEIVDRIGSGDAYISGVLYGVIGEDMNCQRAVEYGNATAATKCTIPGDMPQSPKCDIDSIIKQHKSIGINSEMDR